MMLSLQDVVYSIVFYAGQRLGSYVSYTVRDIGLTSAVILGGVLGIKTRPSNSFSGVLNTLGDPPLKTRSTGVIER